MNKMEAAKLAKVINYFANEMRDNVWEAEVKAHFTKNWVVKVHLNNTAYRHELNALMMIVDNTITASVFQEVDKENQIIWRAW